MLRYVVAAEFVVVALLWFSVWYVVRHVAVQYDALISTDAVNAANVAWGGIAVSIAVSLMIGSGRFVNKWITLLAGAIGCLLAIYLAACCFIAYVPSGVKSLTSS